MTAPTHALTLWRPWPWAIFHAPAGGQKWAIRTRALDLRGGVVEQQAGRDLAMRFTGPTG